MTTQAEYAALTAACDGVLRSRASVERVAIDWLHVMSEHPVSQRRYTRVLSGARVPLRERVRDAAGALWPVARGALDPSAADPLPDALRGALPARIDVLIISHLLGPKQLESGGDFYFGDLAATLNRAGVTTLTVLRSHVRGDAALRRRAIRSGPDARCVLPRTGSLAAELAGLRLALRERRALHRESPGAADPFASRIASEAAHRAVTGETLSNLRLHRQIAALCRRVRPRMVLLTYEGHAWERIAFHAARSADGAVRCVGYQHTILFPRQHAIGRALGPAYDPDVVLTVGDVTRRRLARRDGLRETPIEIYGTHRRAPSALPRAVDDATRCLVIPEGLEVECVTLFDFAWACAARLPHIRFVLRMHPVLPFAEFVARHARFAERPPNVVLSEHAGIAEDFARCRWALYRGTSAAVHATLAGMRPLYVTRPDELPIDPLFDLAEWRRQVATADDVAEIVARDERAAGWPDDASYAAARTYCERYMQPEQPAAVLRLLGEPAPAVGFAP